MPRVFLSYRRSDTAPWAGRLYDALVTHFGAQDVFLDLDTVEPGAAFVEVISNAVSSADVVVALIGPRWLEPDRTGRPRIQNPDDYLRLELATALAAGVPVLPLIVDGATLPAEHELPAELAPLGYIQALVHDRDWNVTINLAVEAIARLARQTGPPAVRRRRESPPIPLEPLDVHPDTTHDRAKALSLVMTDISFEKARVDLPALCLAFAGNLPSSTQADLAREVSALESADVGHRAKVLMLGLKLEEAVGLRVLTEAVESLGPEIKIDSPVGPAASDSTRSGLEIFYSYAHEDEDLRAELEKHLSILRRQGVIEDWHDRRIGAGKEWAGEIDQRLEQAKIILLLVSADFVASDYCYDVELKRAMERHELGDARVIPIILRPVYWKGAPFGKLNALPTDAKAVTQFSNRDEAFMFITEGIFEATDELATRG